VVNTTLELPVKIDFDARGLVPVIAQEAGSREVLLLAWANEQALAETLRTGQAHYYSRSRQELWHKGATSGNVQQVHEVRYDCDGDALLYLVSQTGPACHTGEPNCFFRGVTLKRIPERQGDRAARAVTLLEQVVAQRLRDLPAGSWVTQLAERGVGYTAQKVVEEAGETIVAALQLDDEGLKGEAADLLFHLTVLLRQRGLSLDDVGEVLLGRHDGN
jgi:phosphoribosyl-ATP pyrophosphohydrolase/phosphoribosyl-AMP cyclohydrolase